MQNTEDKIDYISFLKNDSYLEGARQRMNLRLQKLRKKEEEVVLQRNQNTNSKN